MRSAPYVAACIAAAVAITFALRAIPFAMKSRLGRSPVLADLGTWMPLGAVTVLAIYCFMAIDLTEAPYGAAELAGIAVTTVVHLTKRNAVLSIVSGTAACLILANWVLP